MNGLRTRLEGIHREPDSSYVVRVEISSIERTGLTQTELYTMRMDPLEHTATPEGVLQDFFEIYHQNETAQGLRPSARGRWKVAWVMDQLAQALFDTGFLEEAFVPSEPEANCSICADGLPDPEFALRYPRFVCNECSARAVNSNGGPPEHVSFADDGDNPVFIDGLKCWRRYRFGGFVTMRDDLDCQSIGEFYQRHAWEG
jgi:hypothetical protein